MHGVWLRLGDGSCGRRAACLASLIPHLGHTHLGHTTRAQHTRTQVVGGVGGGKSSLLGALVGHMSK